MLVGDERCAPQLVGGLLRVLVGPRPAPTEAQRHLATAHAEQLLVLARQHRVSGRVAAGVAAAELRLPGDVAAQLSADRAAATALHMTAVRGLADVVGVLDGADVPHLVVKGPVLSSHWYGDAGARRYGDLDLLVAPGGFADALDALGSAGFEELATNWAGHRRLGVAETPLQRGPTAVDLHWDLVGLAVDRADVDLRTEQLLARAVPVTVGGCRVRTLDAEDTLLHLCVHGGLAGARRLLHLLDVDVVVRSAPDWDLLVARADAAGCRALALGVLQRARRVLGTPVPDEVLELLEPHAGLRLLAARLDGLHGDGVTGGGVQLEALRDRPSATLRAATRRLRTTAGTVLTGRHPAGEGTALAWRADGLPAAQVAASRAAYLSWVAARATPVTARPTRDAARLQRLFAEHEPHASMPLADVAAAPRLGRTRRAWVVRGDEGALLGLVVTSVRAPDLAVAFPFLVDPAAASTVARLVERSSATTVIGRAQDVAPLEPHLARWRGATGATWAAALEHQMPSPLPPSSARVAGADDVDELVDVVRAVLPSAFPVRALARRWVRRVVRIGCVVLAVDGDIVGYCAVDGATDRVEVLGAIGLLPAWRGRGLALDLTTGAAHAARRRGRGLLTVSLPRLEARVAEVAPMTAPGLIAALAPPRRLPGEPRLWRLVWRLTSRPAGHRATERGR